MTTAIAILLFVVALVICVLIHELGHLLTAKVFGMRADRYFVGFGPTLWSTRKGETEYGLKAFPLGGFVSIRGMTPLDERRLPVVDELFDQERLAQDRERVAVAAGGSSALQAGLPEASFDRLEGMLDERGTPGELRERIVRRLRAAVAETASVGEGRAALVEILTSELPEPQRVGDLAHRLQRGDEGRFYHDRPVWQRAVTIATGPVTHLAIAFLLLFGLYALIPQPTGELTSEIGAIIEDTPAEAAGLQEGDLLQAVAGVESTEFAQLREEIRVRPGQATTLLIERDGEPVSLTLTPRPEIDEETGETFGFAGFATSVEEARLGPTAAVIRAAVGDEMEPLGGVWPMLGASVEGLAQIFSPQGLGSLASTATGAQERDPAGGVSLVGAASLAGQAGSAGAGGIMVFVLLLASINVFFFIFNMVPLPPFDGGHLAVLAVEKSVNLTRRARGRPADYTVDPRAVTAVAIPVLLVLAFVFFVLLWLDIVDPISFG
ncbi:MAG: site-2 protease family protein [Nitriliruptoraceae bacterium]|nr:site-2 protease family protein [Nitriliruptoraceae bacterium]